MTIHKFNDFLIYQYFWIQFTKQNANSGKLIPIFFSLRLIIIFNFKTMFLWFVALKYHPSNFIPVIWYFLPISEEITFPQLTLIGFRKCDVTSMTTVYVLKKVCFVHSIFLQHAFCTKITFVLSRPNSSYHCYINQSCYNT